MIYGISDKRHTVNLNINNLNNKTMKQTTNYLKENWIEIIILIPVILFFGISLVSLFICDDSLFIKGALCFVIGECIAVMIMFGAMIFHD